MCDKAYPWSQRRCLNGAQIAEPNPNIGASKRDQSWPRQLIPPLRTLFGTRDEPRLSRIRVITFERERSLERRWGRGSNPLIPTIKIRSTGKVPNVDFLSH